MTNRALQEANSGQTKAHQKNKHRYVVWLRDAAIVLVIITAVIAWQTRDMLSSDGSVIIAQQNLVSLEGEVHPMLSTEQANLVYFFAPWCQICSLSIGNLAYLSPEKVNVVVIALDYSSIEAVEAFVNEHGVKAPVYLGNPELKSQFQIQGYPSYYMIDKDGKIQGRNFGYSTAIGLKLREAFGAWP
uniref:TlpA family protein disulfide reductase n=1 Tax=Ningiella ruwaisensis TaxID=2364274 RepID=UPI00109F37B1|nr:TlpA disulfide reductase family protein [Ningiella ruwaisensis]